MFIIVAVNCLCFYYIFTMIGGKAGIILPCERSFYMIRVLFCCHGNMLRGIPIGLNVCERKNVRGTLKKLWLTDELKLAYNKGTKKAVHSSEWLPKSYVSIKIVTFALVGGWLFFCTYNHNDKYPKRNHQRKCLICTHVIPPPFGDGSQPAVETACLHNTRR